MAVSSCAYCGKYFNAGELTPLYEKDKRLVLRYCERCVPEVRANVRRLAWSYVYRWGEKGE
jgi:ribosomal protein L24E